MKRIDNIIDNIGEEEPEFYRHIVENKLIAQQIRDEESPEDEHNREEWETAMANF